MDSYDSQRFLKFNLAYDYINLRFVVQSHFSKFIKLCFTSQLKPMLKSDTFSQPLEMISMIRDRMYSYNKTLRVMLFSTTSVTKLI